MPATDRARSYPELLDVARRRLRRLGLTPPLDPDALRAALERERGTTISVIATDELPPGSAFAVTGTLGDREVVLHEARTTSSHQQLILLHEYAHMLLRHPPSSGLHARVDVESFQEIDASVVAQVLGVEMPSPSRPPERKRWWPPALRRRSRPDVPVDTSSSLYARAAEQEAETLATILLGWVPGHAAYIPTRPRGTLGELLGDEGAF